MRAAGRRRPSGEAGSDSYLASVSDLMSGLIFIFVITLAVFALRLATETETQREENERLASADRTRRRILEDIAMHLENAGIKVEILYEHGVLRLSEEGIHFEPGDDKPLKNKVEDHHKRVGYLARVLAEVIPCYVATVPIADSPVSGPSRPSYCSPPAKPSDYHCDRTMFPSFLETLLIEGHTDTQKVSPGHRFRNNLELSSMRAATVFEMLESCEPGITAFRNNKKLPVLSTSGYGSMRLANPGNPLAKENRRIDLRFLVEPPTQGVAGTGMDETILGSGEIPVQTEVGKRYGGD